MTKSGKEEQEDETIYNFVDSSIAITHLALSDAIFKSSFLFKILSGHSFRRILMEPRPAISRPSRAEICYTATDKGLIEVQPMVEL